MDQSGLEEDDLPLSNRPCFQFTLKPDHKVVIDGEPWFRCDVCPTLYKYGFSLKRHFLRTHIVYKFLSDSDVANCKISAKKLILSTSISPEDTRMFVCHICNDLFSLCLQLSEHITVQHKDYQEESAFLCKVCGSIFPNKQALSCHSSIHKNYKCHACAKEFSSANLRDVHERSDHSFCKHCNDYFPSNKDLSVHMKETHSDKFFPCQLCHAEFATSGALAYHLENNHPNFPLSTLENHQLPLRKPQYKPKKRKRRPPASDTYSPSSKLANSKTTHIKSLRRWVAFYQKCPDLVTLNLKNYIDGKISEFETSSEREAELESIFNVTFDSVGNFNPHSPGVNDPENEDFSRHEKGKGFMFDFEDSYRLRHLKHDGEEFKRLKSQIGSTILPIFICDMCGERAGSREEIWDHQYETHPNVFCQVLEIEGGEGNIPRDYLCLKQEVISSSPPASVPDVIPSSVFTCSKCRETFSSSSSLYEHIVPCANKKSKSVNTMPPPPKKPIETPPLCNPNKVISGKRVARKPNHFLKLRHRLKKKSILFQTAKKKQLQGQRKTLIKKVLNTNNKLIGQKKVNGFVNSVAKTEETMYDIEESSTSSSELELNGKVFPHYDDNELNKDELFISKKNIQNGPLLRMFKALVKDKNERKIKSEEDIKKLYKCDNCPRQFIYHLRYLNHISNGCTYKKIEFDSSTAGPSTSEAKSVEEEVDAKTEFLKKENESDPETLNMHKCKACNCSFSYLANLRKHMRNLCTVKDKVPLNHKKITKIAVAKPNNIETQVLNLLTKQTQQNIIIPNPNPEALGENKKFSSYSCDICFKIFLNYFNLMKHKMSHKLVGKEEPKDEANSTDNDAANSDTKNLLDDLPLPTEEQLSASEKFDRIFKASPEREEQPEPEVPATEQPEKGGPPKKKGRPFKVQTPNAKNKGGRPKKNQTPLPETPKGSKNSISSSIKVDENEEEDEDSIIFANLEESPVKSKGRPGRPSKRKLSLAKEENVDETLEEEAVETKAEKRPKKAKVQPVTPKVKRGRPRSLTPGISPENSTNSVSPKSLNSSTSADGRCQPKNKRTKKNSKSPESNEENNCRSKSKEISRSEKQTAKQILAATKSKPGRKPKKTLSLEDEKVLKALVTPVKKRPGRKPKARLVNFT